MMYADSSALVKLVVDEDGSVALRSAVRDERLASSVISVAEVQRAFLRRDVAEASKAAAQMIGSLDLVDLDRGILRVAGGLAPLSLRTLDAIHVASALAISDGIDAMVTYDLRMAAAAELAGLRVLSPN